MRKYSGFIVVLFLAAIVFAPVDVPFTLESVAKALPVQEWILLKTPDGTISSSLKDHRNGKVLNAGGYQFDRGDLIEMNFTGSGESGSYIKEGEVVASIVSNKLDEQMIQLQNMLEVEKANLDVISSGQKIQFIRQLEEEVNLAREDLKLRKKTLERSRQLHEDGLIAMIELEAAENSHEESAVRVKVAEKALAVGTTGEKKEMQSLSYSKISSLQKEISFLEKKQGKYTITVPFSGAIRFETLPEGDRLVLVDTSATLLLVPVKLRDSRFLSIGQEVSIQLVEKAHLMKATILDIQDRVEVINREPVVIAKAIITSGKEFMGNGMPQRCHVNCGNVRVFEFLKRSVRWW